MVGTKAWMLWVSGIARLSLDPEKHVFPKEKVEKVEEVDLSKVVGREAYIFRIDSIGFMAITEQGVENWSLSEGGEFRLLKVEPLEEFLSFTIFGRSLKEVYNIPDEVVEKFSRKASEPS